MELSLARDMKVIITVSADLSTAKGRLEEYVDQLKNGTVKLVTKDMEDQGTQCFFPLSP